MEGGNMKGLVRSIHDLAQRVGREVKFMEVCGTHTMAAFRTGLRQLLPANVKLISGPGCPVCVTGTGYLDAAVELCRRPGVIVTTFGDLMRVPGSESSLERERATGAQVHVVYSPRDAIEIARMHPAHDVVFLGVGFETTAPAVAWSILRADRDGLPNYSVLCAVKTMPQAMHTLLRDRDIRIDGFICPGHVSVVTGAGVYRFLAARYAMPCVISGFEAWDILKSIEMLLQQVVDRRAEVEIEYSRSVTEHGNFAAQNLIRQVFRESDADWRGLGTIPRSGLTIRRVFGHVDAEQVFRLGAKDTPLPAGCRCGDVLRGVITPSECVLFGKACTPLRPVGPCMVSSEGTCAAWHKYELRAAA
jgi:hydrogenase expression/formation protein HypD